MAERYLTLIPNFLTTNGIWDCTNLLPIARRGTTASPISINFENTPVFLIDASVFGGSSGSPVFILNQGMFTEKSGKTILKSRLLFVGVIARACYRIQKNQIVRVPTVEQEEMIDLGIVFKAKTVVETIEAYLKAKGIT